MQDPIIRRARKIQLNSSQYNTMTRDEAKILWQQKKPTVYIIQNLVFKFTIVVCFQLEATHKSCDAQA
jgi:hypothetical protein